MTKDETSMEDLYQIVRTTVAKQAKSVERFGEEPEDIVQEVMIKVVNNWDSFKGKCKTSSWVFRVVRNTIINIAIKHNREKRKCVAEYSIEDNEMEFEDTNYGYFEDNILHDEQIMKLNDYVEEHFCEERKKVFRGLLKGYSATKVSDVFDIPYVKVTEHVKVIRAIRLDY